MKIVSIAILALSMGAATVSAAGVALVYDNEEGVTAGRSWPALIADGGAAIPADAALASANTLLYGDGDGLFRGLVARLDNDLDIAIVRRGERVGDSTLQSAHAARWRATLGFLRTSSPAGASSGADPDVIADAPIPGEHALSVKINGKEPGTVPLVLKERFNKSRFRLEVVNTSTAPLWNVSVRLTANPTLSFWKEGRRKDLNDVPSKVFEYVHQAIFKPLKPGKSFSVPIEAYFIKERDYVWDIKLTSKGVERDAKALVRFE